MTDEKLIKECLSFLYALLGSNPDDVPNIIRQNPEVRNLLHRGIYERKLHYKEEPYDHMMNRLVPEGLPQ